MWYNFRHIGCSLETYFLSQSLLLPFLVDEDLSFPAVIVGVVIVVAASNIMAVVVVGSNSDTRHD